MAGGCLGEDFSAPSPTQLSPNSPHSPRRSSHPPPMSWASCPRRRRSPPHSPPPQTRLPGSVQSTSSGKGTRRIRGSPPTCWAATARWWSRRRPLARVLQQWRPPVRNQPHPFFRSLKGQFPTTIGFPAGENFHEFSMIIEYSQGMYYRYLFIINKFIETLLLIQHTVY